MKKEILSQYKVKKDEQKVYVYNYDPEGTVIGVVKYDFDFILQIARDIEQK